MVEQFVRFALVGLSGYAVNLAVFALGVTAGLGRPLSAWLAFLVAVANNFHWNRRWTFGARDDVAPGAAGRFFVVSVMAFLCSLALMEGLVAHGLGSELAQLVAIGVATPFSFVANRAWSFAGRAS